MGKPARRQLRDNIRGVLAKGRARFTDLVKTGGVTKSSLDRILGEDGQSVTLNQLDELAYVMRVEPWQLLHPDFDVAFLGEWALTIARAMDDLPEHVKPAAHARFVQDVGFANLAAGHPAPAPAADDASAPAAVKPIRLRKLPG